MTGSFERNTSRKNQHGYVLLSLLLIIALMIIAAAAIVPTITFEIKRDREEEMIHRGVQYSRAIRAYYKKFGRYPTKLEDLESSNNMRFLRKRYKDPITGKDFKLLHFGDVKLTFTGGVVGAGINGATALNNAAALNNANVLGGQPAGLAAAAGLNPASAYGNQPPLAANPSTPAADNSSPATDQPQNPSDATPQPAGQQPPSGTNSGDQLAGTTFGGSAVVGVVSTSKKETIREFNHKRKYNEWQFIYDPGTDRGGLLMTPNQPPLQGFGQGFNQPGMQNMNGQYNGNGASGTQNNLNSPSSNSGNPEPPSNPPPQQQ